MGESVLAQLYPDPFRAERGARLGSTTPPGRDFFAIPDARRARMLLPADSRLAAAALLRARRPVDKRQAATTAVARALLRCGAGRVLFDRLTVDGGDLASSIEGLFSEMTGEEVRISVFLGPPRANRKPVVQLLRPDGELIAVAKVGTNDLTARLARAEATALQLLGEADLHHTVVPSLIGLREWNGFAVLVQSALPVWEYGLSDDQRVWRRAMREISAVSGLRRVKWTESEEHGQLLEAVSALEDHDLRKTFTRLLGVVADANPILDLGAWHGDLTAWNLAVAGDRALVWDWERFTQGVPVGFDLLHHWFLPALKRGPAQEKLAGTMLVERAPELLDGLVVGADEARATALLYLVEIGRRFSADGQARTGTSGGDVAVWLGPVVEETARERSAHG